mgnify:FL=1
MSQVTLQSGFSSEVPAGAGETEDLQTIGGTHKSRSRYETVVAVRGTLQARMLRGRFFNARLFADPAWDMLLELYVAAITQRRLTISRLSERCAVPMTTTLRWINALENEGLAEREAVRLDRRRIFVQLSKRGIKAMDAYFDSLPDETTLV